MLGEFGAVSIVSGRISGETETLPLRPEQFETFNVAGAYAAALVLALIALATLFAMNLVRRRDSKTTSPVTLGKTQEEPDQHRR